MEEVGGSRHRFSSHGRCEQGEVWGAQGLVDHKRDIATTSGLRVPYKIDIVDELGLDIQGFAEIRPWTARNMWQYSFLINK